VKWQREMPVTHETVTVLGSRVKCDSPAWTGLDWSRVTVREQSTLLRFVLGSNAPADHHLDVHWMHPNDREHSKDCEDMWCVYRVRPRRKGWRFEQCGEFPGWKLVRSGAS
jgi:hypothetical protein